MTTYQDAQKQLRKVGCANATGDALQAMSADLLAERFALRAPTVYVWGQAHGVDLFILARTLRTPIDVAGWEFLGALLEDRPLAKVAA